MKIQKYLSDTYVLESLARAFTDLGKAKPSDPIVYLANHLLVNAH